MSSTSGRHRTATRQYSAEEQALNQISKEVSLKMIVNNQGKPVYSYLTNFYNYSSLFITILAFKSSINLNEYTLFEWYAL